jgi:protein KRI1
LAYSLFYRNAAEIARHPRNLTSTVRRQDTTRKEARERRNARKEEELLQKREEVKRLKALKMKELRRKFERIGKEGGLQDIDKHQGTIESQAMLSTELLRVFIIALQDLDLEGDWDPDAHDRQMAGIYGQDDDGEFYDEEKPTWDDDINIDDIVPPVASSSRKEKKSNKDRKKGKKANNGDEDYEIGGGDEADGEDAEWDDEEWDGTEEMRKKKLQEYMDSLLELEFNDVVSATRFQRDNHVSHPALVKVAGIPTRFKYIASAPQTFGLTAAEILMADDRDLNQYMGVKKYAPYRKGANWDKQRPERLKDFRDKLNTKKANGNGEGGEVPVKKRKGKKERQKAKAAAAEGAVPELDEPQAGEEKKRKLEESPDRVDASSPKKRKRRHKKSSQTAPVE